MFLGSDRLAYTQRALAGEGGIKVDLVGGIFEGGVEIRGDAGDAVRRTESAEFFLAPSDEDGIGHDHFAGFDLHSALFADGHDGADKVLVGAHASGDAVHDDADFMFFHIFLWVEFEGVRVFSCTGVGRRLEGQAHRYPLWEGCLPIPVSSGRHPQPDHRRRSFAWACPRYWSAGEKLWRE